MVKKISALIFGCLVVLMIFGGCEQQESSDAEEEKIKIGAVLPLTGDVSSFGQSSKNALEMLVEETNQNGGVLGKKIKIIYKDDKNKPENAVKELEKLINDEKIVAVIGSATSECSIAMGSIATKNKIPMITATATDPKVTEEGGEYVYRACFNDAFQGNILAQYVSKDLNKKTAAVIYDAENGYSKNLAENFKSSFEKAGGKIVAFENYLTGEQDFSNQLEKVKQGNPEVLLLPNYYNSVGKIACKAKLEGIKSILIGGDGWDSSELLKTRGKFVDGAFFSNHYSAGDACPELVEFNKAYNEKYHKVSDASSALAYDACKILLKAMEKAESTEGDKIKNEIKKTEISAVSGKIKFNGGRDPIKSVVITKIENGEQKFIKKVNP